MTPISRYDAFESDVVGPLFKQIAELPEGVIEPWVELIPRDWILNLFRGSFSNEISHRMWISKAGCLLRYAAELMDWVAIGAALNVYPEGAQLSRSAARLRPDVGAAISAFRMQREDLELSVHMLGTQARYERHLSLAVLDFTDERRDYLAIVAYGDRTLALDRADALELAAHLVSRRPDEPLPDWLHGEIEWAVAGSQTLISRSSFQIAPKVLPCAWRAGDLLTEQVELERSGNAEAERPVLRNARQSLAEAVEAAIKVLEAERRDVTDEIDLDWLLLDEQGSKVRGASGALPSASWRTRHPSTATLVQVLPSQTGWRVLVTARAATGQTLIRLRFKSGRVVEERFVLTDDDVNVLDVGGAPDDVPIAVQLEFGGSV